MPVGFLRPIAHGMWTLSRALGIALADADSGVAAAVQFKRPFLMPGKAAFVTDQLSAARDRVPLSAQCLATDTPLLRGEVWRSDDDRR